jgi:hypothetical protein
VNVKPDSLTPARRSPKLARADIETMQRRRVEQFRVLAAVADRFPKDADTAGRASGTVSAAELAKRAGVSGKAVSRALKHWQKWRVLWVHWRREQIRFERVLVETLLAAWADNPRTVASLLQEHRAKREAEAPQPRVPKTPLIGDPQTTETASAATPS